MITLPELAVFHCHGKVEKSEVECLRHTTSLGDHLQLKQPVEYG